MSAAKHLRRLLPSELPREHRFFFDNSVLTIEEARCIKDYYYPSSVLSPIGDERVMWIFHDTPVDEIGRCMALPHVDRDHNFGFRYFYVFTDAARAVLDQQGLITASPTSCWETWASKPFCGLCDTKILNSLFDHGCSCCAPLIFQLRDIQRMRQVWGDRFLQERERDLWNRIRDIRKQWFYAVKTKQL